MTRLPFVIALFLGLGCDSPTSGSDKSETQAKSLPASPAADATVQAKAEAPKEQPAAVPALKVGDPAPSFALTDLDGKTHRLDNYRGKVVVLEWFNPECPFVNFAHGQGPLKDMAARLQKDGVVWLAINSNAPGKQGHSVEDNRKGAERFAMSHPILRDESGEVGRKYGAEKTPHMFVLDEKGVVVYRGAIDNAPMGEVDGGGEKVNYVEQALASLKAGKAPAANETPAYGCTVKYS